MADDPTRMGRRRFLGALAATLATPGTTLSAATDQAIQYDDPLTSGSTATSQTVTSPDGSLTVTLDSSGGRPTYRVERDGTTLITDSELGLTLADGRTFGTGATVTGSVTDSVDRTWEPPWGRYSEIAERYEQLSMSFDDAVPVTVTVRAFDDGIGLRYTVHGDGEYRIVEESTAFGVATGGEALWYNDDPNKYEQPIRQTSIEGVGGANTPITMVTDDAALAIHEADLTDYAAMRLAPEGDRRFRANLVAWPDGETKVRATDTHVSPWRTITVGDTVGDLIEANLIVNLAQPSKVEVTDWIEPGKYMGIWWELHIGESTWVPGDRVGATTENARQYVEFCADHGIGNLLAEGWNVGWSPGGLDGFDDQNFIQSTTHFDREAVLDYGAEHDVDFVAHNETGAQAARYDENMADIFATYKQWGVPAVKNGYVNPPFHNGQAQQSQWAVNHYRRMVAAAADSEVMINTHEPIKPTGERRTWPNFMTREGVQGMEYQNFTGGLPADHSVTVAQTRMLAGPVDYTPGIFDLTDDGSNVNTTRARQLSHYPVLFSGLQMVADLPENYLDGNGEAYPEFEFVEDVPASWDETHVIDASLGEYVAIARRSGDVWYVGTQTGEARTLELPLSFLVSGPHVAETYGDAPETDLRSNPEAVAVDRRVVDGDGSITVEMARGGGHAMRLFPADGDEPYCPSLSVSAPERTVEETVTVSGETAASSVRVRSPAGTETITPADDGSFEATVDVGDGETTFVASVDKRNAEGRCRARTTVRRVDALASWTDATGDDAGPGTYTYPSDDAFSEGALDLTDVTLRAVGDSYEFTATVAGPLENPWGLADGFSVQYLQIYVRTGGAGATAAAPGVGATLTAPYQRRVLVDGERGARVQRPDGTAVSTGSTATRDSTITVTVPRSAVGDLSTAEIAVAMLGYDGHTDTGIRPVRETGSRWRFGGADGGDATNVIDVLMPGDRTAGDALGGDPTLPYVPVDASTPPRIGMNPAGSLDDDPLYEDVDGDGEGDLFDAVTYYNNRKRRAITANPQRFDFDGDGEAGTIFDVLQLYRDLL